MYERVHRPWATLRKEEGLCGGEKSKQKDSTKEVLLSYSFLRRIEDRMLNKEVKQDLGAESKNIYIDTVSS